MRPFRNPCQSHTPDTVRVAQVGALTAAPANGINKAVQALSTALARRGQHVQIHVLGKHEEIVLDGVNTFFHKGSRLSSAICVPPSYWKALKKCCLEDDVIHCHGLWSIPALAPSWVVRGSAAKLIISTHGMLAPWSLRRSRQKKTLVWSVAQRRALASASCFHATAESEYNDIRSRGFSQPVAIIPYGAVVADPRTHEASISQERRLLFLSRLHPVKGLEQLLVAWTNVQHHHASWRLIIAGGDETAPGYLRYLRNMAANLGAERVLFYGGVFGKDKESLLQSSELFVLPSETENFGIAVLEALAHGLPVIASQGTPWSALEEKNCGWWIKNDVVSLSRCLDRALALDRGALSTMGQAGRSWVQEAFSWNTTAERMSEVYLWLSGRGLQPECVRTT